MENIIKVLVVLCFHEVILRVPGDSKTLKNQVYAFASFIALLRLLHS